MAIYLLITTLIIAVHLLAVQKRNNVVKSVTKLFLIPSIYITFSTVCTTMGLSIEHEKLLIAVMVFYTLGDMLLELDEAFIAGGLSFAIGHVLYSAYFIYDGYSMASMMLFIGIWIFIYIFLFEPQLKYARPKSTPYLIYASFVMLLGVAVGASNFGEHWISKMLAVAGTFSYAFSDALVIMRAFKDHDDADARHADDVLIMVTYIGANILLLAGVMLR